MRHRLTALSALLIIATCIVAPKPASAHGTYTAQPRTYTVQPGETLTRIAAAFGLSSWGPLYGGPQCQDSDRLKLR